MDRIERKIFNDTLAAFQERYPKRNINMETEYGNEIVYVDGKPKFCITGHNLLHSLNRLCESIEDELR